MMLLLAYPEFKRVTKKVTEKVANVLERSPIYYNKNRYGVYELYFSDGQWQFKCEIFPSEIEMFFGNEDNFRNDFILQYAIPLLGVVE